MVDLPLKEPKQKSKAKIKAVVVTSPFNVSIVATSNRHSLYTYASVLTKNIYKWAKWENAIFFIIKLIQSFIDSVPNSSVTDFALLRS